MWRPAVAGQCAEYGFGYAAPGSSTAAGTLKVVVQQQQQQQRNLHGLCSVAFAVSLLAA
jgi:hypothetical protein